jgi:hypothetical protein
MFYAGNPQVQAPGMVFFVHMILPESQTRLGKSVGEPSIVTGRMRAPHPRGRQLVAN